MRQLLQVASTARSQLESGPNIPSSRSPNQSSKTSTTSGVTGTSSGQSSTTRQSDRLSAIGWPAAWGRAFCSSRRDRYCPPNGIQRFVGVVRVILTCSNIICPRSVAEDLLRRSSVSGTLRQAIGGIYSMVPRQHRVRLTEQCSQIRRDQVGGLIRIERERCG